MENVALVAAIIALGVSIIALLVEWRS